MSTVGERLMKEPVVILGWRLQFRHYLARSNPSTRHVLTLRFMLESEHLDAQEKRRKSERHTNFC